MANIDDNTPLPGSVFTPRQVRWLKIAVIGLGVVIMLGFLLMIVGMVRTATQLGKDEPAAAGAAKSAKVVKALAQKAAIPSVDLGLPKDARILSTALAGNRLAVTFKTASGVEIMVIDLHRHKVVSRLRLKSQ